MHCSCLVSYKKVSSSDVIRLPFSMWMFQLYATYFLRFSKNVTFFALLPILIKSLTLTTQKLINLFLRKRMKHKYRKGLQKFAGVNILAWNNKLFPKGNFQAQKLFPSIFFQHLKIALHLLLWHLLLGYGQLGWALPPSMFRK